MRVKKNKAPVNWILRAAGVLLCLVLASSYLVCGLFARYTTSASGSDSARVAKFKIEESGITSAMINASLAPGGCEDVELKVQNLSEVAVEYEVTVENETKNLPLTYAVLGMADGKVSAVLPANDTSRTYILRIQWPTGAEGTPEYEKNTSPELAGQVDTIKVTVRATQID